MGEDRAGLSLSYFEFDGHAKSRKCSFSVIPAKAGIQYFQTIIKPPDPVFQRGDGLLQSHQISDCRIIHIPSDNVALYKISERSEVVLCPMYGCHAVITIKITEKIKAGGKQALSKGR